MNAGAGDDQIQAVAGQVTSVTLGAGADLLNLTGASGAAVLGVTDFQTGDAGDVLGLHDLMSLAFGWDHSNPFGEGYLRLVQRDANTVLQFDADGGGDDWSDLVLFQNTDARTFTAFNLDGFAPDGSTVPGEHIVGDDSDEFIQGAAGPDTIEGLGGDDRLEGDFGSDLLLGGASDDTLDGGASPDTLDGGDGVDLVSYADAVSGVTVNLGSGSGSDGGLADTLIDIEQVQGSAFGDILTGDSRDNALYGAGGDDTLTGGLGGDTLYGGADDDVLRSTGAGATLQGGAGNDTLQGGGSLDFASYADATGAVVVDLTSSGPQSTGGGGTDTLIGIEAAIGSAFSDTFLVLGPDTQIDGGAGDDLVSFAHAAGPVNIDLAHSSTLVSVEALAGSAFGDRLAGLAQDDNLAGLGGDDTLVASAGNDTLQGGAGVDLMSYANARAGVVANLATGTASDGFGGTDSLSKIEDLLGSRFDDALTGTKYANRLDGAGGDDSLAGGKGDDILTGAGGGDALDAGKGADALDGGAGNDVLDGGAGADTVYGGLGGDQLTGGGGADLFVFTQLRESGVHKADLITDLSNKDVIDLSAIDANSIKEGDQAFKLAAELTGHAGQAALSYDSAAGITRLQLDVNGDGKADAEIDISGDHSGFDSFVL